MNYIAASLPSLRIDLTSCVPIILLNKLHGKRLRVVRLGTQHGKKWEWKELGFFQDCARTKRPPAADTKAVARISDASSRLPGFRSRERKTTIRCSVRLPGNEGGEACRGRHAWVGKALRAVRPTHRTSAEPFLRAARSESEPYLDNTRHATPDNMFAKEQHVVLTLRGRA